MWARFESKRTHGSNIMANFNPPQQRRTLRTKHIPKEGPILLSPAGGLPGRVNKLVELIFSTAVLLLTRANAPHCWVWQALPNQLLFNMVPANPPRLQNNFHRVNTAAAPFFFSAVAMQIGYIGGAASASVDQTISIST